MSESERNFTTAFLKLLIDFKSPESPDWQVLVFPYKYEKKELTCNEIIFLNDEDWKQYKDYLREKERQRKNKTLKRKAFKK